MGAVGRFGGVEGIVECGGCVEWVFGWIGEVG